MSCDNITTQSIFVVITFYPKFINNIKSYHLLSPKEYDNLINIVNDKTFFIENFFRTSKNSYDYICNDNIEIIIINDEKKKYIIEQYLEFFDNDFDLFEMITSSIKEESDSISSISDNELADTVNIIKIFNLELNDKKDKAKEILDKNPHLLDDDILTEYFKDPNYSK
jgi:hypothetical protein